MMVKLSLSDAQCVYVYNKLENFGIPNQSVKELGGRRAHMWK